MVRRVLKFIIFVWYGSPCLYLGLSGTLWIQCVPEKQRSFPHSWLATGFVTRLTQRVPLVEQELHTLPEHMSSSPVFSGVRVTRSLDLCVCFVDRCLSFCTFSFGHYVVCSSSIYGFWLPLWYLQTLLISVKYNVPMEVDPGTSCIVKVCIHGQMFASKKYDFTNVMTTSIH